MRARTRLVVPVLLGLLPAGCAVLGGREHATAVTQPSGAANRHYPGNRAPLAPSPLVKLPVGAVRARGWLEQQLRLQNDGFHGHLTAISRFLKKHGNAWLAADGRGDHGWEEVPYWLKGFGDCAYLLDDAEHIAEAERWIEGALASQRPDGYFGPRDATATVSSTAGPLDLWPDMVMLMCLQSHHERTGDPRVIALMQRYFRWQLTVPDEHFLPPYWQHQRGGDNLWSVYWLYNRTGEPWLLELADKVHRCTADWTHGVPDWHNVNMAQAFGGPTFHWMQSGDPVERDAADRNWRTFRSEYGQVPGGMFGGDENCRRGFRDPRQAIETCGMVEMMFSCERLLQVTGDVAWADRCEDVAFNSLPASMTADLTALRYLTAPNQPLADKAPKNPGIENGGAMFQMNPHLHRCCQHNVGHGWPYFVEHLVMAAPDDGVALPMYGPCRAQVTVGDGVVVEVEQQTRYPFRDTIELVLRAPTAVTFPLFLRVPGWCAAPQLAIDGAAVTTTARGGEWLRVDRRWPAGESRVTLTLPMRTTLRTWHDNHDSVSVDRGPLTYSLRIDEHTTRDGGTDAWPAWSITPGSAWNYGLWRPRADQIEAEERAWPADDRPWTQQSSPIALRTEGRRIDGWQLDPTGLIGELQQSPVRSDAPLEALELVPMGACRLRVSAFPVVEDAATGNTWNRPPAAWSWQLSASHCFTWDTLEAVRDGKVPGRIHEPRFPRFTWWDHRGGEEWFAVEFAAAREVSSVSVWWFDDQPQGGCAVPASWRVEAKGEDGAWRAVDARGAYGVEPGAFQRVAFTALTTTALRLVVQLQDGKSGGIYELRID